MNTRERDRVIDIMKGLGIILMIYGHTHYIPLIGKWLYTFHMPLFFFLSGCFYSSNFNIKRNCQRIILPYFSFAIIMCVVTLFVSTILAIWNHINATDVVVDKLNDFKSNIIQALYGDETSLFFKTLWFLPILFIVQFAYWGIQKISGKGIHFVCALMLCASLFLYYKNINLPYFVDTVLLTLPYYHCGSVFYQNKCRIEKMGVHVAFSLILIPLLIAALAMYNVDYKYNIVPWYNHILSLMTIVGGYVILNKAQLKASFIEKIGKNSIFYLGLHRSFFLLFLPVLSRLSIGAYLQSFILCILTTLSIYFLINCMGEKKKMLLGNIK